MRDVAICPECGHREPFVRTDLLLVGGASGSGKTAVCSRLVGTLPAVVLDADILWSDADAADPHAHFERWLRLAKNLAQSGQRVVLFGAGTGVPANLGARRAPLPARPPLPGAGLRRRRPGGPAPRASGVAPLWHGRLRGGARRVQRLAARAGSVGRAADPAPRHDARDGGRDGRSRRGVGSRTTPAPPPTRWRRACPPAASASATRPDAFSNTTQPLDECVVTGGRGRPSGRAGRSGPGRPRTSSSTSECAVSANTQRPTPGWSVWNFSATANSPRGVGWRPADADADPAHDAPVAVHPAVRAPSETSTRHGLARTTACVAGVPALGRVGPRGQAHAQPQPAEASAREPSTSRRLVPPV